MASLSLYGWAQEFASLLIKCEFQCFKTLKHWNSIPYFEILGTVVLPCSHIVVCRNFKFNGIRPCWWYKWQDFFAENIPQTYIHIYIKNQITVKVKWKYYYSINIQSWIHTQMQSKGALVKFSIKSHYIQRCIIYLKMSGYIQPAHSTDPYSPLHLLGKTRVKRQRRFWPCLHSRNLAIASNSDPEQWMQI